MLGLPRWRARLGLLCAVGLCSPSPSSGQAGGDVVRVTIATTHGDIHAELYPDRAPVTVSNFLAYVDDGVFDGGAFHRSVRMDNQPSDSVRVEVVQARPDRSMRDRLRPPIPLERTSATGLSHLDGMLSMARSGPDSARSSFFICVGDQPSLDFGGSRNPDGQGFAAFGRVVSGMDVVRRIQSGDVEAQTLVEPVAVTSIRRATPLPSSRTLASVQERLDSLAEHTALPGLALGAAFADGSSVGFAAGFSDTITGRRLQPTDRMLQGSVGKTYFGAVALQLVAEGGLELDARLEAYLGDEPWFDRIPNAGDVTVRQIMSHTSGIVRYELSPAFLADLASDPMRSFTPEERLAYLFDSDPAFPAGAGWEYSDTNYILVAMLIERVTGRSAYREIERWLLLPLGLSETTPSDRPRVEGLVNGYAGTANPFGDFDETMADGGLAFNPQFEWGGGGFASTAEDLALWVQHVHEGRAFAPSLLGEARDGTAAPVGPEATYGLGTIMMELPSGTAWGHSGFMPGYRTEAYYFPEHALAVALQVNTSDGRALPESPLRILDGLARILTGG